MCDGARNAVHVPKIGGRRVCGGLSRFARIELFVAFNGIVESRVELRRIEANQINKENRMFLETGYRECVRAKRRPRLDTARSATARRRSA